MMQKKTNNYWNPGSWVLIWEHPVRAIQWIPTGQGLDGFQRSLRSCAWDVSSFSIGRVQALVDNCFLLPLPQAAAVGVRVITDHTIMHFTQQGTYNMNFSHSVWYGNCAGVFSQDSSSSSILHTPLSLAMKSKGVASKMYVWSMRIYMYVWSEAHYSVWSGPLKVVLWCLKEWASLYIGWIDQYKGCGQYLFSKGHCAAALSHISWLWHY